MMRWPAHRPGARFALDFSFLVFLAAAVAIGARSQSSDAAANVVLCRVLETHAGGQPPIAVVLFHQRDRLDGRRLGELLQKNSGATVEIQVGENGPRQSVPVFRLKSCFGRGLFLRPADAAPRNGEIFTMRFPAAAEASAPR